MNKLGVMLAVALLSGCALTPRGTREDGPLVLGDTAPVVTERGLKSIGQIDGRIRFHFGGPVAGRGATNGQALVWDGTELRWEPGTVSAPAEADTLASVLARGNTSGAVDLIVNASQGLVVGGATTSGVRLEFDSADGGKLAFREGDDSALTQFAASDGYFSFPNGSELKVRIGAGSYQVGLASDVQVAWYPTANASGTPDLSLERGGVGILKVADGTGNLRDLQTRTETIGAATTAGARLEVNGGVLTVREGDDSADAPLQALSLTLTTALPIASGGTSGTTATAGFDALDPLTTQGDVLYHNGTNTVRLGIGTATHVLTSNGAGANPSWQAAAGGGTPWVLLTPLNGMATSASGAAMGTRGTGQGHSTIQFSAASTESFVWESAIPDSYVSGSNLIVKVYWSGTAATTGDVVWNLSCEAVVPGTLDTDADSYDTANAATTTTSATAGVLATTTFTLANGSVDDATAGCPVRWLLQRIGGDGADTCTGIAEVMFATVEQ